MKVSTSKHKQPSLIPLSAIGYMDQTTP